MNYIVSRKFKKSFDKLPKTVKEQFIESPSHPILHNHYLSGKYSDCKSFNVNGDVRVVFSYINKNTIHLIDIGTHSQLYR